MGNVLAIRHVAFEHGGSIEPVLRQRGYELRYIDAGYDDLSTIDAISPDLLVILGGPIGANEETIYPFLKWEMQIIELRLKRNLPILGICLGSQLMARVLGATVFQCSRREIGWAPITLTDAGQRSSLVGLQSVDWHVLHWHGDTFDLPDGAVCLASTEIAKNQAFCWGKKALGLQFHVEIRGEEFERWLIGHACEIATTPNVTVSQLRADTERWGQRIQQAAQTCFTTWLNEIAL